MKFKSKTNLALRQVNPGEGHCINVSSTIHSYNWIRSWNLSINASGSTCYKSLIKLFAALLERLNVNTCWTSCWPHCRYPFNYALQQLDNTRYKLADTVVCLLKQIKKFIVSTAIPNSLRSILTRFLKKQTEY